MFEHMQDRQKGQLPALYVISVDRIDGLEPVIRITSQRSIRVSCENTAAGVVL